MKNTLVATLTSLYVTLTASYGHRFSRIRLSQSSGRTRITAHDSLDNRDVTIIAERTEDGIALLDIRPA